MRQAGGTRAVPPPSPRMRISHLHLAGLRLGALSADGKLRMYDALDVMQLANWSLVDEIDVPGALCFAWGQQTIGPAYLVVGFSDGTAVVSANEGGGRKWSEVCRLSDARDAIQSVSWAPHIGRSMQLIATGGRDGAVYVYMLRLPSAGASTPASCESKLVAKLPEHRDAVWRVEWNATGSLLASSGDDGTVRVWQPDATGAAAAWRRAAPPACSLRSASSSLAELPSARNAPRSLAGWFLCSVARACRPVLSRCSFRPVAVRLDGEERWGSHGLRVNWRCMPGPWHREEHSAIPSRSASVLRSAGPVSAVARSSFWPRRGARSYRAVIAT